MKEDRKCSGCTYDELQSSRYPCNRCIEQSHYVRDREEYTNCQMCGRIFKETSMVYVNNILMCSSCVGVFADMGITPSKPLYPKGRWK